MAMTIDQLLAEAMRLAPADREAVAERLYASLNSDAPLSAEWEAEIERRVSEIAQSPASLMDGDAVFEEARLHIQRIRSGT
ncbi:MAG: addiction module protein [Burkholderiales bacterium]|nr:addiction module protein [Phycisphaerae bacterium]